MSTVRALETIRRKSTNVRTYSFRFERFSTLQHGRRPATCDRVNDSDLTVGACARRVFWSPTEKAKNEITCRHSKKKKKGRGYDARNPTPSDGTTTADLSSAPFIYRARTVILYERFWETLDTRRYSTGSLRTVSRKEGRTRATTTTHPAAHTIKLRSASGYFTRRLIKRKNHWRRVLFAYLKTDRPALKFLSRPAARDGLVFAVSSCARLPGAAVALRPTRQNRSHAETNGVESAKKRTGVGRVKTPRDLPTTRATKKCKKKRQNRVLFRDGEDSRETTADGVESSRDDHDATTGRQRVRRDTVPRDHNKQRNAHAPRRRPEEYRGAARARTAMNTPAAAASVPAVTVRARTRPSAPSSGHRWRVTRHSTIWQRLTTDCYKRPPPPPHEKI